VHSELSWPTSDLRVWIRQNTSQGMSLYLGLLNFSQIFCGIIHSIGVSVAPVYRQSMS
jgi:hypothetical protein